MPQCLALANAPRTAYYGVGALVLVLAACRPGGPASIAPQGLGPIDPAQVRQWIAPYAPTQYERYDVRWEYRTSEGATKNRASARIAPPDSLRFDFRGPFGRSGAAVVVGDASVWSRPEGNMEEILGAAPLFWAALGIPRGPGKGMTVTGVETPERRAWRYAGVTDTFDFIEIREQPVRLLAEMRREGRIVAVARAQFAVQGRHVAQSQLDFPVEKSSFVFTVDSVTRAEAFGPEIWRRP